MSSISQNTTEPARQLPPRPSLEHLKKQAKRRLASMRLAEPGAKLAEVQYALAREHGFRSWRALKAELGERQEGESVDPVGDWVGEVKGGLPLALHIRRLESGGLGATLDVPSQGYFDDPVDDCAVVDDRLTFVITVRGVNVLYRGDWDSDASGWVGVWTQWGLEAPLTLSRGRLSPAPTLNGLDGLWDGTVEGEGGARLTFRIRTDQNGTHA